VARLPSPHDDVAQAVEGKWKADDGLQRLVPGGLQQSRLSSFQPGIEPKVARALPYATFDVAKGDESLHQTSGAYLDYRKVVIEIRGLKAGVEAVLAYVRDPAGNQVSGGLFNRQTLQTQAPFVGCTQAEDDDLKIDPDTRAGEDIWIGTIQLSVMTARPE